MSVTALTSAEISLPAVGLTDDHAGQPRMSPLAAASVALMRSERMAERACALPGVTIAEPACAQIRRGGGIELAREPAAGLARVSRVDALHVFPLGAEAATREVAAEFRVTRL